MNIEPMTNLKATNKHIKTIINYVVSYEENKNNRYSKLLSLDNNLLFINSLSVTDFPSSFNVLTIFNEPTALLSNKYVCSLLLLQKPVFFDTIN
ncbi:hypothetical protein ENUP19_0378G0039 [Entamoeba nuttalli]|uniref:Uncharacterized protein n=1 Tax=Entamoeba nuttalli TaxID=412467 RepID=A0ABQ0DZ63_9EUKA